MGNADLNKCQSNNLSFSQFDPILGTLTEVQLHFNTTVDSIVLGLIACTGRRFGT
ncbi:MAG: choice-of-anchor E domain-containing protein [Pirellulales bacterium]|nr:choice-of-anchor E domain-containing protein [Pirellulales bacterium]